MTASMEDGSATGIDGNQTNDDQAQPGAVYGLVRDGMEQWSQQAYVKATNTEPLDGYGRSLALLPNRYQPWF